MKSRAVKAEARRGPAENAHANFDDLMDPYVGGSDKISSCNVEGVKAANHWKLADGVSAPSSRIDAVCQWQG